MTSMNAAIVEQAKRTGICELFVIEGMLTIGLGAISSNLADGDLPNTARALDFVFAAIAEMERRKSFDTERSMTNARAMADNPAPLFDNLTDDLVPCKCDRCKAYRAEIVRLTDAHAAESARVRTDVAAEIIKQVFGGRSDG